MRNLLYAFFIAVPGVAGCTYSWAAGVTCAVGGFFFVTFLLWAREVSGGDVGAFNPLGWWAGDSGSGTIFDFGGFDGSGGDGCGGGGD